MTTEDPMFTPTKTATPYAGTTGHAGSPTSRERAEREVEDGTTQRRQRSILEHLSGSGPVGSTVAELRRDLTEHHGQISGSLSSMHRDGLIVALMERRNGCGVYVLPEHRQGRLERPFRPNRALTEKEQALVDDFRTAVQLSADSLLTIRPSSARALLKVIERLSGA